MQTSELIARLVGPILLVVGLSALFQPRTLREIGQEAIASRALVFVAGILAMLGGLAIVNVHNLWVAGWPVIITVLGWLAILGGVVRIAFPGLTQSIGSAMLARESVLRASAGAQVLFGAYLMVMGYL